MRPLERVRRGSLPILLLFFLAARVHGTGECVHQLEYRYVESVCSAQGYEWYECILCGYTCGYKLLPKVDHEFSDWYVLVEPTCTQSGVEARDCIVCGEQELRDTPHTGHEYIVEVQPPTCTAKGYTLHYCPGCGDRFRTDYTSALGHRYNYGVITKEPSFTAMGRMRYTCIGCADTYEDMIPLLTNPFCDIPEESYYTVPVLWAAACGITSGIDETHFGPELPCSRAQVVTFLWRRAGKPTPQSRENPFEDVPAGSYFEQAVLWAAQTGITTGTDEKHFSPDAACNRAQVVTFLHRFHGCPEPFLTVSFPDVPEGAFFCKAVSWAAEREITLGMDGGLFRPELQCTRAQIVTFLYRDAKAP